ncbi:MAG TPA: CAP domain-containing protein [Gemmataceae bacterium]|jgi:hypothetical protein|nr:CAP domain-containing protein [Gemmataceae bacterium]
MLRRIALVLVAVLVVSAARGAEPDFDRVARLIVERTNQFRADNHRPPLTVNAQLMATAREFADWMAATDLYSHEADGRQPWDRAKAKGYEYCEVAENIAYAWRSNGFSADDLLKEFVEGWEKSPPHRKNMLDPDLTEIGVAVARSPDTGLYYAVQDFGRPRSLRIEFRVVNQAGVAVRYKVGDKTYDLQPRVVMTHELCRPAELTLLATDGSTAATARPANGERFVVTRDPDLKLVKEGSQGR